MCHTCFAPLCPHGSTTQCVCGCSSPALYLPCCPPALQLHEKVRQQIFHGEDYPQPQQNGTGRSNGGSQGEACGTNWREAASAAAALVAAEGQQAGEASSSGDGGSSLQSGDDSTLPVGVEAP